MVNEHFKAVANESERILLNYPTLAGFFTLFSLTFAISCIGLIVNVIINAHYPITHGFFLIGIVGSLLAGVIINTFAQFKARRNVRTQIDTLLMGSDC